MKREIFNLYLESISSRFDVPKDDIFTKTKRRQVKLLVDSDKDYHRMISEIEETIKN